MSGPNAVCCDRCGKFERVKRGSAIVFPEKPWRGIVSATVFRGDDNGLLLCPECAEDFDKFLAGATVPCLPAGLRKLATPFPTIPGERDILE
ncbi:MAG TPA: hypothetical protein VKT80_09545 [Chloroflexota bacterium]|nr:hypothetical protein [Chloroflexota bacterium]